MKVASPEEERQSEALREAFDKIAGDDMEIDAYELRDILNAAFRRGKVPAPLLFAWNEASVLVLPSEMRFLSFVF